jgi:hypothetical protein
MFCDKLANNDRSRRKRDQRKPIASKPQAGLKCPARVHSRA